MAFLTEDTDGIPVLQRDYMREAFKLWGVITGIDFKEVTGGKKGHIFIGDGDSDDNYAMSVPLEKYTGNRHNITKRVWINLGKHRGEKSKPG